MSVEEKKFQLGALANQAPMTKGKSTLGKNASSLQRRRSERIRVTSKKVNYDDKKSYNDESEQVDYDVRRKKRSSRLTSDRSVLNWKQIASADLNMLMGDGMLRQHVKNGGNTSAQAKYFIEPSNALEGNCDVDLANDSARRGSFCDNLDIVDDLAAKNWNSSVNVAKDPIWRGSFIIFNNKFDGIAAYMSNKACPEVINIARSMPELLSSQVLMMVDVWPEIFINSPPTDDIIDLYIFPENESDYLVYSNLLEFVTDQKIVVKIVLDDSLLLIFPSQQLPHEYWRTYDKYYLWGVFRGKNAFFPYQNEDPKAFNVESIGATTCESSGSKNHITQDSFRVLNQSSSREHPPFRGKTMAEGLCEARLSPNSIRRADSPISGCVGVQETETVAHAQEVSPNNGFKENEGENTCAQSIYTSVLQMAVNFDDDDDVEVTSVDKHGEQVGRYCVKPSLAPTLGAIIEKHGDIAEKCLLRRNGMLTPVLERICQVIRDFEALGMKDLKRCHLESLDSTIADAERVKLDVEWLQIHNTKLNEYVSNFQEYKKLVLARKSKKMKLMELEREIESVDAAISVVKSKCKSTKPKSLSLL